MLESAFSAKQAGSLVVGGLDVLSEIQSAAVNAVVWRRSIPESLAGYLALEAARGFGDCEQTGRPGQLQLDPLVALLAPSPVRAAFLDDLMRLSALLEGLVGRAECKATLLHQRKIRCPKFHSDFVALRLLCTYVGPGTEIVPESAVNRRALQQQHACLDSANQAIVPKDEDLLAVGAGDVVLLKGENWPGNRGRGAVHRSPEVDFKRGRVTYCVTVSTLENVLV